MPFRSASQRRWMYANKPEMAKRWEKHTPKGKKLPEKVKKESIADKIDAVLGGHAKMAANAKNDFLRRLNSILEEIDQNAYTALDDVRRQISNTWSSMEPSRQVDWSQFLSKILSIRTSTTDRLAQTYITRVWEEIQHAAAIVVNGQGRGLQWEDVYSKANLHIRNGLQNIERAMDILSGKNS